jgi:hypothetical protein
VDKELLASYLAKSGSVDQAKCAYSDLAKNGPVDQAKCGSGDQAKAGQTGV